MEDIKIEDREAESAEEKKQDQLDLYKYTVKDVRYILKQYGRAHPAEALECIEKLVGNPRLLKSKTKKG